MGQRESLDDRNICIQKSRAGILTARGLYNIKVEAMTINSKYELLWAGLDGGFGPHLIILRNGKTRGSQLLHR